ncbi:hypothetical protein FNV43_RR10240 [Rhamnella rubrinervis]|uniref:Uncharacterized protein n=1 Tax=Rhamnella rubrinervis TaxID=2594499 RepID=A0A8K0MKI6_9ROSA|nr:hypothetical protein FNV43_RR10240 [Rhamnella rubrinervis]
MSLCVVEAKVETHLCRVKITRATEKAVDRGRVGCGDFSGRDASMAATQCRSQHLWMVEERFNRMRGSLSGKEAFWRRLAKGLSRNSKVKRAQVGVI